jgi:hypothetical protein
MILIFPLIFFLLQTPQICSMGCLGSVCQPFSNANFGNFDIFLTIMLNR